MSRLKLASISILGLLIAFAIAPTYASAESALWANEEEEFEVGARLTTAYTGAGTMLLKGKIAGVNVEIACTEEHSLGWIENSASTGMGLGSAPLHYLSCSMLKPAGGNCKVQNSLVGLTTRHLTVVPGEEVQDEFTPETGSNLGEIVVESCSNSALNGTYPLTGSATAEIKNETSSLEFTEKSGSKLKLAANTATLVSTVDMETKEAQRPRAVVARIKILAPANKVLTFAVRGETKEIEAEYKGLRPETPALTVPLTQISEPGAYKEALGGTCVGKRLKPGDKCKIKITLEGVVGATGEVEILAGLWILRGGPVKLK
jgi:hypothetical protein